MKKIFYLVLLVLVTTSTAEVHAQLIGSVAKQHHYVLPKTTVNVSFVVETKSVKKGPYAKYAQQYLGITAPLNDSESSAVISSSITSGIEGDMSEIYTIDEGQQTLSSMPIKEDVATASSSEPIRDVQFVDMGIEPIVYQDAVSSITTVTREKSLEQMARSAAEAIFTLRKRRFDLITGEMGENVFGAGLEAAIAEMARVEEEYLSLFIGKTVITTQSYSYEVMPEVGKGSYILARFSAQSGIVALTDLSGDPVVLTITPEGSVKEEVVTEKNAKKKVTTSGVKHRIADMAECKLFFSSEQVSSKRIPILQYGITVEL